jgi:hypothetical protein
MTTATKERQAEVARDAAGFLRSKRSFLDFLDFVYILERPQTLLNIAGGRKRFQKWPHLMSFAGDLTRYRKLVDLKARQDGFSWLVAAYAVWQFRFQEGANVLMFSQGQTEATRLLEKTLFIYRNLPESWKLKLSTESRAEMAIAENDSRIFAYPSTSKAGQGESATLLILDEADRHEDMAEAMTSVLPTIQDTGGQIIMGSTVNKQSITSVFKETYRAAIKGRPVAESPDDAERWHSVFWSWRVRPGRDDVWFQRTRDAIPDTEELPPDLYMQANYPNSEEEALAPAKAIATFDPDVLLAMREECKEPIRRDGPISIYRDPHPGQRLCSGTDTAHGVGRDYSVTVIMDKDSGFIMADIMQNTLETEAFAYESLRLMEMYNNPIWGIEDNEWGGVVLKTAQRERYPTLYKRPIGRTRSTEDGWHTDGRTRPLMWSDLREAINRRWLIIPNRAGLAQFFDVIDNPDHGSIPEALQGAHDDYPVAVGIAWQMRGKVYKTAPSNFVFENAVW